jgi:hypothetical protein
MHEQRQQNDDWYSSPSFEYSRMTHQRTYADYDPRIGVFWFVSTDHTSSRLLSLTWPFNLDDENSGLRAAPYDHKTAWPEVQRLDRMLRNYDFDYFPRGRLEFYPPMRRWLLSVDPKLNRSSFVTYIVAKWSLPIGHLTVKVEPAYSSAVSICDP